ncbi:hypothetical protein WOLCODRAFT_136162 [Wolfiporia cocos MD-104 SS10]|uniref:Uncharacterized protein n=1 Tax=Wolfiporia cocos (strain MD-104) TaxID=742152 RepID=A0A2H3J8Q0_WOLCO|nr:hypothetical protein WOLCODRAFT_136162 [Wolfiporia cocos MD-104 SS10]
MHSIDRRIILPAIVPMADSLQGKGTCSLWHPARMQSLATVQHLCTVQSHIREMFARSTGEAPCSRQQCRTTCHANVLRMLNAAGHCAQPNPCFRRMRFPQTSICHVTARLAACQHLGSVAKLCTRTSAHYRDRSAGANNAVRLAIRNLKYAPELGLGPLQLRAKISPPFTGTDDLRKASRHRSIRMSALGTQRAAELVNHHASSLPKSFGRCTSNIGAMRLMKQTLARQAIVFAGDAE